MRSLIYPFCCTCGRFTRRGLICLHCSPPKPVCPRERCPFCFNTSDSCCDGLKPKFNSFRFLYEFNHVRHLIRFMKFNPSLPLAKNLAQRLAAHSALLYPSHDFDFIVPAPSSRKSIFERGFNQGYVLAHQVSRTLGVTLINPLRKLSEPQSLLTPEKRKSPLIIANKLLNPSAHVLLIDDVLTTGETALACLNALNCRVSLLVLSSASKNFPFLLREM